MASNPKTWASAWAGAIATTLAHLKNPANGIELPTANESLTTLLTGRFLLSVNDRVTDPADEAARRLTQALHESFRENAAGELRRLVSEIDKQITKRLDAGEECDELIRSADFGRATIITFPNGAPLVLGHRETLPRGHKLLELIPETEAYVQEIGGAQARCCVLGLPQANKTPRPFYQLAHVLENTRQLRSPQKWNEQEAARLAKVRADEHRSAREQSVEGRLSKLESAGVSCK